MQTKYLIQNSKKNTNLSLSLWNANILKIIFSWLILSGVILSIYYCVGLYTQNYALQISLGNFQ